LDAKRLLEALDVEDLSVEDLQKWLEAEISCKLDEIIFAIPHGKSIIRQDLLKQCQLLAGKGIFNHLK
jgi:hypothetical protein